MLPDEERKGSIGARDFFTLSERISRLEERWELSVQIARLEERINAAAQAVPLVAEPLKVQALELSRRVVGLETAKNESAGKSSGISSSWGVIVTVIVVGLAVIGFIMGHPH